ncbi:MAG: LPS assembly lipoprotein LptE [candidate division Zixibacteria bacterium]|nr:LPS assembly lipoprotein LptE [candidate division Zixibacteria bacterium]
MRKKYLFYFFLSLSTLCCLLSVFLSCGPYSFTGSGLPGIKTIAIPLFENQTQEYGIREELSETLVQAFIQNNTLKVVNERIAESVLKGTVTKYEKIAHTFDEQENVKEYIVRIYVKIVLEDKTHNKNIWEEENLEGWGIYSATEETEQDGKTKALAKLTEDILNRTVKGW